MLYHGRPSHDVEVFISHAIEGLPDSTAPVGVACLHTDLLTPTKHSSPPIPSAGRAYCLCKQRHLLDGRLKGSVPGGTMDGLFRTAERGLNLIISVALMLFSVCAPKIVLCFMYLVLIIQSNSSNHAIALPCNFLYTVYN